MRSKISVLNIVKIFLLFLTALLFNMSPLNVMAEEDALPVEIHEINYEEAYILVKPQGNTKVYYSQTSKNKWHEIEGVKQDGYLKLDISWISEKSEYSLSLKGSENETEITAVLPASNTKLKVKFDAVEGILIFDNEEGAVFYDWRKSTSYVWNKNCPVSQQDESGKKFLDDMEALRVKGGKIVVRLQQVIGTSASDTGQRPSKMVTVSIPKRANAPKLKVNAVKLTLNTSNAMEYMVYSVGGVLTNDTMWMDCEKNIPLKEVAPEVFATSTKGKDVLIAVRKSATSKAGHSKTTYVAIPGQDLAPTEIITTKSATKFSFTIPKASSENAFQYAVVKAGVQFNEEKLTWKNVANTKAVSFNQKTYPGSSKIYIRTKGITQTNKLSLKMPSKYQVVEISY